MLKNKISLSTAVFLVMGSMIGSGVYIVSAEASQILGNPLLLLLLWVATGVLTLIAATSYTELAGMFPKSGGQYVYLKEAYNPLMGFLYGWSLFLVIQTGTIAAVAVAFAKFTGVLIPEVGPDNVLLTIQGFKLTAAQLLAVASIVVLTFINSRGIKYGGLVQSYLTSIKALTLVLLIVLCIFVFSNAEAIATNFSHIFSIDKITYDNGNFTAQQWTLTALLSAFGVAMVGPLFSSDAWNGVTFIAGEIENPKKNVARSLIIGVGGVTLLYLLTNIGYLFVLPLWGTVDAATIAGRGIQYATSERVGTAAMTVMFGALGAIIMAVLIMISTFGANNGIILSGARVYQTMANDGLFFKKMGTLNKYHVPGFSLWVQCVWASLLCLSGRYGDLLNYVMFVVVLFYILTIAGVFIMRVTKKDLERPIKAPGYPVFPAIYIIVMLGFIVNLMVEKPDYTVPGLIIVLTGVPIYYIWRIIYGDKEVK